MEPRLGSRGKIDCAGVVTKSDPSFNGAATWKSRKVPARHPSPLRFPSFNGAATWKSRKARIIGYQQRDFSASMEPRLGSRGKASGEWASIPSDTTLQWSRDLEVAERGEAVEARFRDSGFNGAATWKSRKGHLAVVQTLTSESVLQWSRDLEVAESCLGCAAPQRGQRASMEPRLGSRGKSWKQKLLVSPSSLQWSRDLEVAES